LLKLQHFYSPKAIDIHSEYHCTFTMLVSCGN